MLKQNLFCFKNIANCPAANRVGMYNSKEVKVVVVVTHTKCANQKQTKQNVNITVWRHKSSLVSSSSVMSYFQLGR